MVCCAEPRVVTMCQSGVLPLFPFGRMFPVTLIHHHEVKLGSIFLYVLYNFMQMTH